MKTKKNSFREIYNLYLNGKIKMERYQEVGIAFLIFVIAGVVGWIYEFFVALVETGEVYMQGGNLLPWINIYAFGAILVVPLTYKLRKYPWAVFLVSAVATGLVELIGGWLVYTIGNGARYWNYDHGLWLIGNINGFVCLLSVVIFGLGCLALIYLVMPVCIYLARKMSRRAFLTFAIVLFGAIMIDEIVNLILKNNDLPNALDLYKGLGFKYQEF
ncbi:putative ABC transporter permease [Candidatus Saccharibacteria bacterium]|nr:putative ABC transporter permease [Candidatus Saccharibacteria bacterium]